MVTTHLDVWERADRSICWPVYIPRLYLWIAKNIPALGEIEAWRLARLVFHRWVWVQEQLPWR